MKLCASMMCADFSNLQKEVEELWSAGIDSYHIDIMDGDFVDNFGMGYQDMFLIKKILQKPIDVHLMVKHPHNYLPLLFELGANMIYIHPEVDADPATTIEKIHLAGLNAGVAINPGTSISLIEELLNTVDSVLVLGVNPGHSGRRYQDYVDRKLYKLLEIKQHLNFEIVLDGAVTRERISHWSYAGVESFVLGTSCLFGKDRKYDQIVRDLRSTHQGEQ